MKDLKHAFGSPDPEFQSRVRQTLFRIEAKEETIVKKKLTFSMAMAMILCVCIITVSALAGSALLAEKPDITQSPLSHSENEQPAPTPDPYKHIPLLTEVFWPEEAGVIFHLNENCENMSYPCTVCLFFDALEAGGKLCALCFNEMTDFASVPTLATQSPILSTPTPQPMLTPVPDYLYDTTASLIAQSTEVFLLSEDDPVYHLDASCGGAEHPHRMNLLSAVWLGRTACGECIGDGGWFYTSETDPYYHPSVHCCVGVDRPLRVTLFEAYALEKLPCGGKVDAPVFVWSAESGNYYHAQQDCSAAERATRVTLPVAENRRQSPCPFCWTVSSAFITPSPMPAQVDIDVPLVYAAQDRSAFHYISSSACAEKDGALTPMPLTAALSAGALPCRECLTCYVGEASELYHMSESCVRLSSPKAQLVSDAVASDRHPCGVCVCFWDMNNARHHRFAHCSAFGDGTNAYIPCPLDFPYLVGSTPCELCVSSPRATPVPLPTNDPSRAEPPLPVSQTDSETTVFLWDSDAPVYHSIYNCSGYEYLYQMNLSDASEANLMPCPNCVLTEAEAANTVIGALPPLWATGSSEFYFYDYTGGHSDYFHADASCTAHPMTAPVAISLETAIRYELHPCPECSDLLTHVIISQPADRFYHHSDECRQLSSPEYITLYKAKILDLEPCSLCAAEKASPTNAVHPSRGDSLFHRTPLCGETVNAPSVSLIDALNTGLDPCPACYGSEAVYTVNGGETYHHPENPCFRFYASSSSFADVSLTEALLRGKQPCEECVLSLAVEEDSTIFFYTAEDAVYHFDRTCASKNGASVRSLYESELIAMSKNPCKKCIPREAYGYVFSSETGAFYHLYDDCVGADVSAPRVPIAVAEARLQTACPNCTGDQDFICLISDTSAFYHVKDVLRGIPDAVSLSRAVSVKTALSEGKQPCICMAFGASAGKTTRECRADLIGEVYYYSATGEYYHLESVCGIYEYPDLLRGAQVHEKNLSPCPACLPNREKTSSVAASVDNAVSHGVILSDEEAASSAR